MVQVLTAQERLTLCRMFVDVAREAHREYMPNLAFGSRLETLVVGVCVAIGHLDGNPFSTAKLAAYLDCPRTSVIRRLDALTQMPIIVRRGTRNYHSEPRFNSDGRDQELRQGQAPCAQGRQAVVRNGHCGVVTVE